MQRGVPGKVEGDEQRGSSKIPLPSTSQSPLPVFIFPPSLEFYADDQASHKQVLTLYNPFPCVLRYKVLSTAPLHYTVVDTEGLVKPNSCIDIVVRHRDVRVRHYGTTDKFRVEVWEEGGHKGPAAGKKEITATLHPTKPENRERGSPEPLQWHPPSHMFSVRHDTVLLYRFPTATLSWSLHSLCPDGDDITGGSHAPITRRPPHPPARASPCVSHPETGCCLRARYGAHIL
ncbi:motile sperm domain-containing 1 [Pelobates cultripes]|uniref:Motile sperm domain-containing protein 3 n=1 Tax=Pelobates cultripes TaxID=61616 RepID=A0AAD1VW43_PELCU|nr:motile sperm domain-containing 1 [Pelobates cultripes]